MEVRFEKLPPKGHLQSLLRFSLPDMAQARRIHRAGLYLNGDGVVVSSALAKGGLTTVEIEKLLKAPSETSNDEKTNEEKADEEKANEEKANEENTDTTENKIEEKVTFVTETISGESRSARAGIWLVISVAVRPSAGEVSTYINGNLCHVSDNLDPADLRLQYKLVVLGGGRQAQNRGGDLRRLTIHSRDFDNTEMRKLYYQLADENPAIGGRATRIQAAFRGYYKRKTLTAEGVKTSFSRTRDEFLEAVSETHYDY
jgi:hypothetical protein